MIAAEPAADRRFSRVNCRGTLRKRAKARAGCPGVAASSPIPLSEQGWAAGHRGDCGFVIFGSRIRGQLWQMRHSLSAVGPQASSRRMAAEVQDRKSTNNAARWLGGPHFFVGQNYVRV